MATFEEILERDGRLVYKTKGISMEPMLRQNRDLVFLQKPSSRLKKNDVALYKRGSQYVLHRVIGVGFDHYLIRGDNTFFVESVPDQNVIGVLTGFVRKSKKYSVTDRSYCCYVRFWDVIYPFRLICNCCRRVAVHAAKKFGILPLMKKLLHRAS